MLEVRVRVLPHGQDLQLPSYATALAAGADVRAAETVTLPPGSRAAVATGLCFELPSGWECQVRPRSGRALREGLTVVNAPGTIDADYRGEVKVLLVNLSGEPVHIERGERIAQLVFCPVHQARFVVSDELGDTGRGAGGFGSTGVH